LLQSLVIRPTSSWRVAWDLISFVLVAYDCVVIPLQVFSPPPTQFSSVALWFTVCFWTLDIPRSFFAGYYSDFVIELRPEKVVVRYLKTFFVFDFTIIVLDWVLLGFSLGGEEPPESTMGFARLNRIFRILRVVRLLRLFRAVQIANVFMELVDYGASELVKMVAHVVKNVVAILLIAHFISCGWYAISSYGSSSFVSSTLIDRSIPYKYTTCLHWALAQFTPSTVEVHPENTQERLYAICIVLFGMVIFSSFVSSITASVAQGRQSANELFEEMNTLHRYFDQHKVSLAIAKTVFEFCRNRKIRKRQCVHECDLNLVKILPSDLYTHFRREVYGPKLKQHPFFFALRALDQHTFLRVCVQAMGERSLLADDVLFGVDTQATHSFLILSGTLHYALPAQSVLNIDVVERGAWVSEAAIWLPWKHVGHLIARSDIELFQLDVACFAAVVCASPRYVRAFVSDFGQSFVFTVCGNDGEPQPGWSTDLCPGDNRECVYEMAVASAIKTDNVIDLGPSRQSFAGRWSLGGRTMSMSSISSLFSQ